MGSRVALLLSIVASAAVACSAPELDGSSGHLLRSSEDGGTSHQIAPTQTGENQTSTTSRDGGPKPTSTPAGSCSGGGKRTAQPSGLFKDKTIDVWSTDRTYDLEVPTKYDPTRAYPIVFVFHGSGGWGAQVRTSYNFSSIAASEAFFVYPTGLGNEWDLDTAADQNKDVALFDQLTAELGKTYCIDATKIFSTGFSNGAFFSNQLGCYRGDKIRAIAAHSGGGPYGPNSDYDMDGHMKCVGPSPAALIVHGTADPIVASGSADSSLAHWTWANGCQNSTAAASPSPCVTFNGCKTPVEKCIIPLIGHTLWVQGTQTTWDFFSRF